MIPYDAYVLHHAIVAHFNTKYDYFRYNGKIRKPDPKKFDESRDRWQYLKLVERYTTKQSLESFLVSTMIYDPKLWVGSMFSEDVVKNHEAFLARQQSITYIFRKDLDSLEGSLEDILRIENGQNPIILTKVYSRLITQEAFIILNNLLGFFPLLSAKLEDDIIWPSFRNKMEKLTPFIKYDKPEIKRVFLERFK